MNERIRALAEQARRDSFGRIENPQDPTEWSKYHDTFEEKFAELIVRECIDVFSKDLPDPTSPDYQLGSLPEVVNRVANVAEHFGVEE